MNAIQMIPVSSSLLLAIGHDPIENVLAVQFHSAGNPEYRYANFTDKDFNDLRSAPSVGSHFSRFVKGKYECQRVSAAPATFADMLEAIKISASEGQAELALSAIMNSPDYSKDEKSEATRVFNAKHATTVGG